MQNHTEPNTGLALVLTIGATALITFVGLLRQTDFFWDFRTNFAAGVALNRGLDAFAIDTLKSIDPQVVFGYNYPTQIAWLFRLVARVPYSTAVVGNAILSAVAIVIVFLAQATAFRVNPRGFFYIVAYLLGLSAAAIGSCMTGNVGTLLSSLIALALPRLLSQRPWLFYFAIAVVASLVKIHMIGFLALPFLLGIHRSVLHGVYVVAFVALVWCIGYWIDPSYFAAFMAAADRLHVASLDGASFLALIAFVTTTLREKTWLALPDWVAYAIYSSYAVVVFFSSWWLSRAHRRAFGRSHSAELAAFLFISVMICLPRLQVYEFFLLIIPVVVLIERCFFPIQLSVSAGGLLLVLFFLPAATRLGFYVGVVLTSYWQTLIPIAVWAGTFLVFARNLREGRNEENGFSVAPRS